MISERILDSLALEILQAGALELRAVPKKVTDAEVELLPENQRPFKYASGNHGPGYVMIKGLVGNKKLIKKLLRYLAFQIAEAWPGIDFIAGNVTGGMIPAWVLSEELEVLFGREVPFVYIRELRKTGGHKELITGIQKNPLVIPGDEGLDTEELVNFAQTIVNGAVALRQAGFSCGKGTCILAYDNPEATKGLAAANIEMVSLLKLSRVIDVAERYGIYPRNLLDDYRQFLKNPLQWQVDRGLTRDQKGGTQ